MEDYKMSNKLNTKGYTGNLLGDIRRTNNFTLTIQGVSAEDNNLELVVDRAFIPSLEIGVITLTHGNDSKTFAGQATWQGGEVTINDTLNKAELDALIEWQKEVYDPETGAVGHAHVYKKLATLTEFSGNAQYVREWTFPVWISGLRFGDLDASNANLKQVSATLQVDPPEKLGPTYGY